MFAKIRTSKFFIRLFILFKRVIAVWFIPIKDFFKKDNILVFHHIPKCAGTSVNKALEKRFFLIKDSYYRKHLFRTNNITLEKIHNCHLISGHFELTGYYLKDRYPAILQDDRYKLFTFVRHPLEVRASLYYYNKKRGQSLGSLVEYIFKEDNYIANRFPCNADNYKDILDRYFFIGINENMQESLDILMTLTGKKRIDIPVINVSKRDDQLNSLSKDVVLKFEKRNALDYNIYEYALNRFNQLKEEHKKK